MILLREIDELISRVLTNPSDTKLDLMNILRLLKHEVELRIAFERAMVKYLQNSPNSPFAAADEFIKWLQFDLSE